LIRNNGESVHKVKLSQQKKRGQNETKNHKYHRKGIAIVAFNCLSLLGLDSLLGGDVVIKRLFNAKARHLLGQSFPVFGMAHGIDDGVQARSNLGNESRNLGHEGSDAALAANDSSEDNKGIRSPNTGPQRDIGDSNLGNPDFSGLSRGVGI